MYILLISILLFSYTSGHAIQYPGKLLNTAPIQENQLTRIYFTIEDFSQQFIPDDQLIIQHARKIHTVIISEAWNIFWHIHPEDFANLHDMSNNGSYYVEATFPFAGNYYLAADFVYANNNYPTEGTVQLKFTVTGVTTQPVANDDHVFPTVNQLTLKNFPLQPNDIYNDPIYLGQTVDPNGIKALLDITPPVIVNNEMSMKRDFLANDCVMFNVTVFEPTGNPSTTLLPLLDANAHVSLVHRETKFIYHGHLMIPSNGMLAADLTTLCDDHRLMTSVGSGTFGPIMIGYFTTYVAGTYDMIIQFKHSGGSNGNMLVAVFQFTVDGTMMTQNQTANVTSNMTSTGSMMNMTMTASLSGVSNSTMSSTGGMQGMTSGSSNATTSGIASGTTNGIVSTVSNGSYSLNESLFSVLLMILFIIL